MKGRGRSKRSPKNDFRRKAVRSLSSPRLRIEEGRDESLPMPCSHSPVTRAPILRGSGGVLSPWVVWLNLRELWRQSNEVHQNTAQAKKPAFRRALLQVQNLFRLALAYRSSCRVCKNSLRDPGRALDGWETKRPDSLRSHRNCLADRQETTVNESPCAGLRISHSLRYSFLKCLEEPQLR
jgi:hypothetical protein